MYFLVYSQYRYSLLSLVISSELGDETKTAYYKDMKKRLYTLTKEEKLKAR